MAEKSVRKKTVFLTGATGLLGSYLLKILLENGHKVFCLARSKNNKSAEERITDILNFWDEGVLTKNFDNLVVMQGDIVEEDLGMDKETRDLLKNEIEEIFHCAAATQFYGLPEVLKKVNVEGTKNVLELGFEWSKKGILNKVNYISSAFICGNHKGTFKEDDLDLGQGFNNPYEQSKFEAESLAREYISKGLRIPIFRPSILVGEYLSGKITDFKMFYRPFYLFSLEMFDEIPLDVKTSLNVIPVDLAARAIYILSTARNKNEVYHITNPKDFPIVRTIDIARRHFYFKTFKFITLEKYKSLNSNELSPNEGRILRDYISYFNFMGLFNSDNTQAILRKCGFEYPQIDDKFLDRLFNFCKKTGFIKVNKEKNRV